MPPKKLLGEQPYEGAWPFEGADRAKLRPAYVKAYQDALRLYWNHMKEKGWAEKLVLYISDEPHFAVPAVRDQMIALCRMIHEVDPAIRIYSSTWRHCADWDRSLDVWGVGAYGCFPTNEMMRLSREGKGIWFTTDGQQCLDTPFCAIERLQPVYCWAYGAEKYEFWGCSWLTQDPRRFGWHHFIRQSGKPGETSWVRYPNGDGPGSGYLGLNVAEGKIVIGTKDDPTDAPNVKPVRPRRSRSSPTVPTAARVVVRCADRAGAVSPVN